MEEGIRESLAIFKAPQAARSYACDLAMMREGSLPVVFDSLPVGVRSEIATLGLGSASLQWSPAPFRSAFFAPFAASSMEVPERTATNDEFQQADCDGVVRHHAAGVRIAQRWHDI